MRTERTGRTEETGRTERSKNTGSEMHTVYECIYVASSTAQLLP